MKSKLNLKNNYCLVLAPIITAAVLLVAYIAGGVFPFGRNNVIYFDMAQRFIPNCYHIWDALHSGDTALWFNWYSGLGVNDTADASFSFFWLVLAVLPRRLIGKAMSLYVVMFFALSSFSACLFVRLSEKVKPFAATLLSVCYAFCGFSVMYYTNMWQDTVFLFPLLMLSLLYLFKKGKGLPYILLVFLNFQCNYYTFALSLLYLFFAGYLYIRLAVSKDKRGECSRKFGISTILGIMLSSFSLVPKLVQTFLSGRFIDKTGFDFSEILKQYFEIAGTVHCEYPEKITMLFATAFPLALVIAGLVKKKKRCGEDAFFLLNIVLLAVLIVCEGANLLMHIGDYKYFPMRMGYALSFAIIWAAAHYIKYINLQVPQYSIKSRDGIAAIVVNAFAVLILAVFTYALLNFANDRLKAEFSIMWAYPVLVILYSLLIFFSGRLIDYRAAAGGILAEIMVLSMLFIPYWSTEHNRLEQSPAYIEATQSVARGLSIEGSKTRRIKTMGTTLNCNYATIMGRASVADWTHMIPADVQRSLIAFGYSGEYTRLHDSGGTALTDALLGVTDVLSVCEESPALYEKKDKKKGYNYYSCRYTLPYGIVTDRSVLDIDTQGKDWITLNNELYTALSGDNSAIVDEIELTCVEDSEKYQAYTFTGRGNSVAYFRLQGASKVNILVNGKKVRIPSIDNEKNKKYPARFNRNLICLGEFAEGEEVRLELILNNGKFESKSDFRKTGKPEDAKNQSFGVQLGYMDLNKLGALCDKYGRDNNAVSASNYNLTADIDVNGDDKVLLLPLQYNGCWSARVDGAPAEVECVAGLITAVEVNSGAKSVEMRFTPTGFKAGLAISVVGVLLLAVYVISDNRLKRLNKIASGIVYCLYSSAFYAGVLLIYIVPIVLNIKNFIL